MNIRMRAGFTVIEVMLFLGVGGMLTAGILVTMGASLNAQRYEDAVSTFQSDIQQQYEDIAAVANNRTSGSDGTCEGARGTSDCVLLGKLLTVQANGQMRDYNVYGNESSAETTTDDYAAIRSYGPRATSVDRKDSHMEWGTGIAPPQGQTLGGVGILVLRSPQSGTIHTFTRTATTTGNLNTMINSAHTGQRTMCVNPGGWTVADTLAVVVGARATSANGVEVRSSQMMADAGMQC